MIIQLILLNINLHVFHADLKLHLLPTETLDDDTDNDNEAAL
jgi:hypothetical protein